MSTTTTTPAETIATETIAKFKVKTATKFQYTDMEKYRKFEYNGIDSFDEKDTKCLLQYTFNIERRNHELMTIFLETNEGAKIELDDIANMTSKELEFCQNLLETLDPWGIFSNQKAKIEAGKKANQTK